ncbi:DUF423 domain-containing protein, partial [bacterium]|nr:DUF423 domain-containing protein [bacterium]
MNSPTNWMMIAASASGALCVMLGAFGAHGLKRRLADDMMNVYETAVQYHMWHTLALLLLAVLCTSLGSNRYLSIAGSLFGVGILLFSGSLYLLAVTGIKSLGMVTPFGGL